MSTDSATTVTPDLLARHREYQALVGRLRDLVHRTVPPRALHPALSLAGTAPCLSLKSGTSSRDNKGSRLRMASPTAKNGTLQSITPVTQLQQPHGCSCRAERDKVAEPPLTTLCLLQLRRDGGGEERLLHSVS